MFIKYSHLLINSLTLLISYTEGKVMGRCIVPKANQIVIFYFHGVSGVCFEIRDEPYGVSLTLTVGPNIRLISILIHCVQH